MTITLSTTLDFGDVDPTVTTVKQTTVSFDPPPVSAVSIVATGVGFSVSPTTIGAGEISAVLTITLQAPASPGDLTATVTVSGDNQTAAIAVTAKVVDLLGEGLAEKHLLLEVPDYGDTTFQTKSGVTLDGTNLNSFLRLGRFDYAREPRRAQELLAVIPQVTASTDPGGPSADTVIHPSIAAGTIFADDVRTRAQDTTSLATGDDPDHGLTLGGRSAESARLYSRGGWRDHSDGNRISTTFGDKVEVIRGNYKMIVLGRQDTVDQAMGWDVGGSHIQDYAPGTMPGASFWLEWIDDDRYHAPSGQKGVWLLVNTTENVYEYARTAGNLREEVWGDVHESYVGSENPPGAAFGTGTAGTEGHEPPERLPGRHYDFPGGAASRSTPPWSLDNVGIVRSNPHIIEKTWAARIDSWTGSPACPVPKIDEQTYADDIKSRTGSSSCRVDSIEEKTFAKRIDAQTDVDGGMTETTLATFIATNTNARATIAEFKGASTIFEGTASATHVEVEASAMHASIELVGLLIDISLAVSKIEFDLTNKTKLVIPKEDELTLQKVDTHLSGKFLALDQNTAALKKHEAALKNTKAALEHRITGLNIQLGL